MSDTLRPSEYVTFVRQGGIPVTLVRWNGVPVRVLPSGGRPVTLVRSGGQPVVVDSERLLPEDIKQEIGYG